MKEKAFRWILLVSFFFVIFMPHMIWMFAEDQFSGENTENRVLAQKPEFSIEAIETYPRSYEKYYNDHLPFRNYLINLYNTMMYKVFRTSIHSAVLLGEDGWLFYDAESSVEDYTGEFMFTDEELEYIAENLMETRDKLAAQGTEFVLFVAPNKERVYSEYMPDYLGKPAEICMVDQFMTYLREHTDIRVVYAYDALMAYKAAHPEQRLYHKTDTHWNNLGAYIGARELLAELGIEIPPLEQQEVTVIGGGSGDLASMLKLKGNLEDAFSIQVHDTALEKLQSHGLSEDGYVWSYETAGLPERKLFVKHDSFFVSMCPYVVSRFSQALSMNGIAYDQQMADAYEKDVYVLEIVERYLPTLLRPIL